MKKPTTKQDFAIRGWRTYILDAAASGNGELVAARLAEKPNFVPDHIRDEVKEKAVEYINRRK